MKPNSNNAPLERAYENLVAQALRARGWSVQREHPVGLDKRVDLVAQHGQKKYAIEVKVAREARREVLQALLADSILQARRYASQLNADPLAVVAAPHISNSMSDALSRYVEAFAPGQAFGYVDGRGLVYFAGEGLEGSWELPSDRDAAGDSMSWGASRWKSHERPLNLFSDINQWLLKVLLGQRLPPEHISVPRSVLLSPSHLARAATVSAPSASRFVRHLSDEGFMERSSRGLHVVRQSELLAKWRAASISSRRHQFSMAWALRRGSPLEQLKSALGRLGNLNQPTDRACLGLFSACEALGVGFVRGGPVHLYIKERDAPFLDELGLVPASPGKPVDVFVRVPRWRESLFRACVIRDGVRVADALQCWLDVSHEISRGQEQAEFLWRRVLAPSLDLEGQQP